MMTLRRPVLESKGCSDCTEPVNARGGEDLGPNATAGGPRGPVYGTEIHTTE